MRDALARGGGDTLAEGALPLIVVLCWNVTGVRRLVHSHSGCKVHRAMPRGANLQVEVMSTMLD